MKIFKFLSIAIFLFSIWLILPGNVFAASCNTVIDCGPADQWACSGRKCDPVLDDEGELTGEITCVDNSGTCSPYYQPANPTRKDCFECTGNGNTICSKSDTLGTCPVKDTSCCNPDIIPAAPPPSSTGTAPKAYWNGADCTTFWGWACDPDRYSDVLNIHLYYNNTGGANNCTSAANCTWLGSTTANLDRENAVGEACGGITPPGGDNPNRQRGFSLATPANLKDNVPHYIYAFAIGISSSGPDQEPNTQLDTGGATNKLINCAPACDTCGTGADACTAATACGTNLTGTCNKTTLAAGACATVTGASCTITTKSCAAGQNCVSGSCCAADETEPACHTSSVTLANGSCGTTTFLPNCTGAGYYCSGGKCVRDGGWSAWSPASCPTACGTAASNRTRGCTNPAPANGGAECARIDGTLTTPSNSAEAIVCNVRDCSSAWIQTTGGDVHSNTSINLPGGP